MPLLILALGLFLIEFFPFSLLAVGSSWFRFTRQVGGLTSLFIVYAIPFVAAWLILGWLRIEPCVAQLKQGRRLMLVGLAVYGLYLLLGADLLSAIPFRGPAPVPQAPHWTGLVAKLPLFAGLALAIGKEFPQAWVAAQLRAGSGSGICPRSPGMIAGRQQDHPRPPCHRAGHVSRGRAAQPGLAGAPRATDRRQAGGIAGPQP